MNTPEAHLLTKAMRTMVAVQCGVEESRVTVVVAVRTSDKTGKDELVLDMRVDGEPLTIAQEVAVREVFDAAVKAAGIIADARAEGVALTLPGKGRTL